MLIQTEPSDENPYEFIKELQNEAVSTEIRVTEIASYASGVISDNGIDIPFNYLLPEYSYAAVIKEGGIFLLEVDPKDYLYKKVFSEHKDAVYCGQLSNAVIELGIYKGNHILFLACTLLEECRRFYDPNLEKVMPEREPTIVRIFEYYRMLNIALLEPSIFAGRARTENARKQKSEKKLEWESKAINYYKDLKNEYPERKDTQHFNSIKRKLEANDNILKGISTIKRAITKSKK